MTEVRRATGTRPLRVGPLEVWPPVVLAPMAGITNAPFRRLCHGFGATALDEADDGPGGRPHRGGAHGGLFVSEMITARGLAERNDKTLRMARFADDEPVRSIQLYGTDPRSMGEAARFLAGDERADHIDLNFGCPVAKVTRKGGGAALPVHRALFREIVRAAVRGAGAVPVTVKLRIGVDERAHHVPRRRPHRPGRGGRGRRPARPHRGAALLGAGGLAGRGGAARRAARRAGPGQRRHLAGRRRPAHGRRDRLRRRGRRPRLPRPPVAVRRPGPRLRRAPRSCRPAPRRRDRRAAPARPPARRLADRAGGRARHPQARRLVPAGLPGGRRRPPAPDHHRHDRRPRRRPRRPRRRPPRHARDRRRRRPPRGKTSGPISVTLPDGWLATADDPTPVVAEELDAVSGG